MKIALLDDYQGVALSSADWSILPPEAEVTVFRDTLSDQDALVSRLEPFAVIGAMRERTPFPRALLERLPNLKLLITSGMRNAAIDVAAAQDLGITVCGTASPGHATAELTWGLILALARRIVSEHEALRRGAWQQGLGRDLRGATLGVVGLGRLGGQVAGFGKAFGMEVIAWSTNLTAERAAEVGAEAVSKEDLFRRSDFITIHQRLSARTRGLVDAEAFSWMKADAYLVNTSRGPIVDRDALIAALREGRIAGAAVDVFDQEPLPRRDELRGLENLLATPHIGYVTRETYAVFYRGMAEGIAAFMQGAPVRVMKP